MSVRRKNRQIVGKLRESPRAPVATRVSIWHNDLDQFCGCDQCAQNLPGNIEAELFQIHVFLRGGVPQRESIAGRFVSAHQMGFGVVTGETSDEHGHATAPKEPNDPIKPV